MIVGAALMGMWAPGLIGFHIFMRRVWRQRQALRAGLSVRPMIVTLISRPDTPRLRRSSFTTLPTFVRLSPASQVESCERVYVAVFHEMYGDDAS